MNKSSVGPAAKNCATMRAAVIAGARRVELTEAAIPEPGPREVRVRVEGCGVCASNLPVWEGREWFTYPQAPGAPGHEGWGVIDAVGEEAEGVAVGDRVAMFSNGAYAEYDVAAADAVARLPESFAGKPFPGEPLACAMNIFRRSEIQPGQNVAVIGVGFLGAVLTRLAARAGGRVIAISRRPFALEIAREFGAAETIPMDGHQRIVERVKDLTGGERCERVIEAVGLQQPLDLASELTREGGRLIIAGYHQDGSRRVNMQLWNWRGIDVVNAHERDPRVYARGMREAVAAVESGALDPWPLFTHSFLLDQLGEALEMAHERTGCFIKALITI
jgi:threonine dehydrogenase-like Zn-dependent dehydrogenase